MSTPHNDFELLIHDMALHNAEFMSRLNLYSTDSIELFKSIEMDRAENMFLCVHTCLDSIAESENNDQLYEALSDFAYAANRLSDKLTELSKFCTHYSLHHRKQ